MGVPQPWEKSKKNLNYVREAGVRQFISTYNRVKDLKGDELLWGDEVEYGIFVLDEQNKQIRLSLRAKEVGSMSIGRSWYQVYMFYISKILSCLYSLCLIQIFVT